MNSFYLILALVLSLVIALVAIANTEPVTVNYIFGRSDVSLIILILGSAFAGALVMGMINLFRGIKTVISFRQSRQEKEALQKQVSELKEEKIFLQAELNKALSSSYSQKDSPSKLDQDYPGLGPEDDSDNAPDVEEVDKKPS